MPRCRPSGKRPGRRWRTRSWPLSRPSSRSPRTAAAWSKYCAPPCCTARASGWPATCPCSAAPATTRPRPTTAAPPTPGAWASRCCSASRPTKTTTATAANRIGPPRTMSARNRRPTVAASRARAAAGPSSAAVARGTDPRATRTRPGSPSAARTPVLRSGRSRAARTSARPWASTTAATMASRQEATCGLVGYQADIRTNHLPLGRRMRTLRLVTP